MLRFAVLTDIHYGFDRPNKQGSKAPALIEKFVDAVNVWEPDCVINLGDGISCQDSESDKKYLSAMRAHFNRAAAPFHSVIGNHEVLNLTRQEIQNIMRVPSESYTTDIKGYRFIFWNPDVYVFRQKGLDLKAIEIEWLKTQLVLSEKPVILCSHIPLDNDDADEQIAQYYDKGPHKSYYPQVEEIRKIIKDSGKVALCLAGHKHFDRIRNIDGVTYITHQSLVDTAPSGAPCGAYSFFEFDDQGSIHITPYGENRQLPVGPLTIT